MLYRNTVSVSGGIRYAESLSMLPWQGQRKTAAQSADMWPLEKAWWMRLRERKNRGQLRGQKRAAGMRQCACLYIRGGSRPAEPPRKCQVTPALPRIPHTLKAVLQLFIKGGVDKRHWHISDIAGLFIQSLFAIYIYIYISTKTHAKQTAEVTTEAHPRGGWRVASSDLGIDTCGIRP